MLVDDHAVVRSGLAAFLMAFDELELVGQAGSGEEAVRLCEQLEPDVVLMDLVMPGMDGATATRRIRERHPNIQVIALTSFKEKALVEGALEAGAIGYLLKNVSTEELADAIRSAHAGRRTLTPEVALVLAQAEKLERLGRAIIDAPPDLAAVRTLLAEHVPGMLPRSQIEIRIPPAEPPLRHPEDAPPVPDLIWDWLSAHPAPCFFPPESELPWGGLQPSGTALAMAPIASGGGSESVGGIYAWEKQRPGSAGDLVSVVQSLAAQISAAVYSAEAHAQAIAQEKVVRELAMAGQIQASFLPGEPPDIPGWQLDAVLEPARETSGDFYDFIPLPDGRLGIVVADVADKGLGAALYMAMSRTLIRTYATDYPTQPDLVLGAASRRILADTRAGLFVTVFYGVLDPITGALTYCNAGHNPPVLLNGSAIQELRRTGMALGVLEDAAWQRATVHLAPGDTLVLYTDGLTDTQNADGSFFGRERLLSVAEANLGHSARDVQNALVTSAHDFAGQAVQFDDITLVVLVRTA
jgi:serine phosphatase RsbU (regulator of sigma subunit)/DNA-binding NarL/FixJ family response regulator